MDRARLEEIACRHGVALIVEFGSTVAGRTHSRSDVDVAVWFERPRVSWREWAELAHELQDLYPGQRLDLAVLNHADPLLLKKVTESCRLVLGSTRRLAELRMYAFKRYQDHRRFLGLEREYVSRTLDRLAPR